MKKYDYIVFDFDGTVCDSGEGIIACVKYAYDAFSIPHQSDVELRKFVGPPLLDSFMNYAGVDEEKAALMVEKYREKYKVDGVMMCTVYDGIENMLSCLKQNGCKLAIGSSKPLVFIEKILNEKGLINYFDYVSGVTFSNSCETKHDIITRALDEMKCTDKSRALMVGDTRFDIVGANSVGIDSVGVTYGYGTLAELEENKATYIADTADEIISIVGL